MTNPHALLIEDRVQPKELPKLSPSSINLFDQDPALWVLKHFYGSTGDFNIHAMRGVAIEEGLNLFMTLPTLDVPERTQQALNRSEEHFNDLAFFWGDDELFEQIEDLIPQWAEVCIDALTTILPEKAKVDQQIEIDTTIEGVPIRGFLDYSTEDLQIDLKTATQIPNPVTRGPRKGFLPAAKKANVRQQSIYHKATGKKTSLLYVSPDGFYHHELGEEELAEAMEDVKIIVEKMKKLLTSPIKDVIKDTVPNWKAMNYSFYWDENLRRIAKELWEDYKPEEDGGY
jgi:hypothetical protein